MTSNNKKKKLIVTSITSLLLILCIAIGILLAPKQRHTTANYHHEKDRFTNKNDIVKVDNDISHFLKADTTEVRSELGSNTCPSGKGLWNMKLVTDLYGYETGMFVLFVVGISSFSFVHMICSISLISYYIIITKKNLIVLIMILEKTIYLLNLIQLIIFTALMLLSI